MMTRLKAVSTLVKRKKLTWFSVKRTDLPVRAAYEGIVSGKRRGGRPIW